MLSTELSLEHHKTGFRKYYSKSTLYFVLLLMEGIIMAESLQENRGLAYSI